MSSTEVVCTLSYNTLGIIQETYPRMRASCNVPLYILDNGSVDGSAEWLRENMHRPDADPPTIVITEEQNLGYTMGCNVLMEQARRDYDPEWFVLLNSDIVAPGGPQTVDADGVPTGMRANAIPEPYDKSWIGEWLSPFEVKPDAWIVGCRLILDDFVLHGGCVRSPAWRLRFCDNLHSVGTSEYEVIEQAVVAPTRMVHRIGFRDDWIRIEMVDWVTFAAVGIRKAAIEAIGLMDESYFLYCSDSEYCLRVYEAGGDVWYNGEITLEHLLQQSVEKADREVVEAGLADMWRFYQEVEEPQWVRLQTEDTPKT